MKIIFKYFLFVSAGTALMQGNQNNSYSSYGFLADSVFGNAQDSLIMPSDSMLAVQERFTEGKSLYEKKCGRCHELHDPSEYRIKKWKENLDEMKYKAKLSKKQYELILGYLSANSRK